MGRNTTSLKVIVNRYVERVKKLSLLLPLEEKVFVEDFLRDLDSTISICGHTGVEDPLEVLLIHLIRKIAQLKKQCGC